MIEIIRTKIIFLAIALAFCSSFPLLAQSYQQMDEHKVTFFTRYLNLTNAQKRAFVHATQELDKNLVAIEKLEQSNPEQYLRKLRSLNELFEIKVKKILQENQRGRWACFQNKEERAVLDCLSIAKQNGLDPRQRMMREIKVRYHYTTLNI